MLGEAQCSKLPPQERSPNFYLMGSHLGPPSLSEMRLGGQWGGAKSERRKRKAVPTGAALVSLWGPQFFPKALAPVQPLFCLGRPLCSVAA